MKKIFGGKSELMTSENLRKYLEEQTENVKNIIFYFIFLLTPIIYFMITDLSYSRR